MNLSLEWDVTTIGELCSNVSSGGTPKSTNEEYYGGNIPWLNTKEINFNRIYDTEKHITNEGFKNSAAKWVKKDSVIVAMYGATAAKVAMNMVDLTTNQACCNLTIDKSLANPKFVYYYLYSNYERLLNLASGAAQQNLNSNIIKEFPINIPSLNVQNEIVNLLSTIDDKIELNQKINKNNSSKTTIDNIRRIFSSFFSWLEDEDYIIKNPVRRIHRVKTGRVVKEVLTDENLEVLRDKCEEIRDLAMVELLTSTGIRVGELVRLNIEDIDFYERECIVFGKGESERVVYFDARTKIHLMEYLQSRKDNNPALFVSLNSPYDRLGISGIETRLRELGNKCNINRVHPHKFRRTMATNAIDKGMPIEQVQKLLGHVQIDTTMQYAMVNQSNVKLAHRKFIG